MKLSNGNGTRGYFCPFCLKRFWSAERLAQHLTFGNCWAKKAAKR
jgi:hypothetical protein